MLSRWKSRVKEGLFVLMVGLFQEITDVTVAVIFAGWELNHNIYIALMFYETEFRMTCRDRYKNALYWDIPTGGIDY